MFLIEEWGLIDYKIAWDKQKEYVREILSGARQSTLIFCEHPRVITIGRNGTKGNIISSIPFLNETGFSIYEVDRGGDVTLHNPGQLVGYPIFNLRYFKQDLHWFLRIIEQSIIELLLEYNIIGNMINGLTGVWIQDRRKICAIGLHCTNWVTYHGFALNVNNNISDFDNIVPCGIKNKEITSISKEIGTEIDIYKVLFDSKEIFLKNFKKDLHI